VTGPSGGSGSGNDYATVAYDAATGAQLWVQRYDGPASGNDGATALAVSPDGSKLLVTGNSPGLGSDYDYATVAYDAATGAQLWVQRYDGPASGVDSAFALGVSPDGASVFVTGSSPGVGSGNDYATVAYDAATGAQLWVQRYNGPSSGSDNAFALGVSRDGSKLFVTGARGRGSSSSDYATVAYDASTGAQVWVQRYDGPGNGIDTAVALAVSPDGAKLFVTGYSSGSGSGYDYATIAYDAATGARLWVKRYDGPVSGDDVAVATVGSPDASRLFVTGYSPGLGGDNDYATVAYSTG
jgi:WD40 repeat protein